jgi:hypothetical protein
LIDAIGTARIANYLQETGQNKRAQEILDRYDKGAKLNELHEVMRGWGYGSWVKEELTNLSTYESLISSIAAIYAAQMASRQAAQLSRMTEQSVGEQLRQLNDYVNAKLKENNEKKEREEKEKEADSQLSPEEKRAKMSAAAEDLAKKLGVGTEEAEPGTSTQLAAAKTRQKAVVETAADAEAKIPGMLEDVDRSRRDLENGKGVKINDLFTKPQHEPFRKLYAECRQEQLSKLSKMVPSKRVQDGAAKAEKEGTGGPSLSIKNSEPHIRLALLTAYNEALQTYYGKL